MRRKDREKDEKFAYFVLNNCEYGTLATTNEDNSPYCIPVSPVLHNGFVYFHCAMEGKKINNIKKNNKVCLSCVNSTQLLPQEFSTAFESAVVIGHCECVLDEAEKTTALYALCEKYAKSNMANVEAALSKSLFRTGVYKIHIETITGKSKAIPLTNDNT